MSGRIDLDASKRCDQYRRFSKYDRPFFSVTVDVGVTVAWNVSREGGALSCERFIGHLGRA